MLRFTKSHQTFGRFHFLHQFWGQFVVRCEEDRFIQDMCFFRPPLAHFHNKLNEKSWPRGWVRAWYVISGSLLLTFRWNKNTQLTIHSSPLKLYFDYVQFLSFLLPTDTFSFRGKTSLFMSAGYLNHVHQAENSLIVLYCHEKLDPPALLRKLRCLSCFYLGIWFRSTLQFYIKSLKNDNFWKVWNPEKTKVWSFFPCEKLTFPFTSRSLRLNNVFP